MAVTRRGKLAVSLAGALAVTGVGVGALALTGHAPAALQRAIDHVAGEAKTPPPVCPLTGAPAPHGTIPDRPVLAVKIENLPEARPQAGLDRADIVYEEPVEGGITRFIALFQCDEANQVGPIRSGRTTDPEILVQYGKPPLAYSGGAGQVRKADRPRGAHRHLRRPRRRRRTRATRTGWRRTTCSPRHRRCGRRRSRRTAPPRPSSPTPTTSR